MIALYQPVINFVRKRLIMTSIEAQLSQNTPVIGQKKKLEHTIEKDFKTKKNNKHREKTRNEQVILPNLNL